MSKVKSCTEVTLESPLRFPGSKRRLSDKITRIVESYSETVSKPDLFIEPFVGGASVALKIIEKNLAQKIGLADKDPLIVNFWKAVFNYPEWLKRSIENIKVNVEKWEEFKQNPETGNEKEQALKCLFLNRTSYSGILADGAGPLGGKEQDSDYKIDCRFYRETISERIEKISEEKEKIKFIKNLDWKKTLDKQTQTNGQEILYYFDPPFFNNADRLYRFYFDKKEHIKFRNYLEGIDDPWILSYDHHEFIVDLYEKVHSKGVNMTYTSNGRKDKKELLITNLPRRFLKSI